MAENTFMNWNPNEDWSVMKPKTSTQDASSSMDMSIETTGDWFSFDGNTGSPTVNSTFEMGDYNVDTNTDFLGDMFNSENIGGTLKGIGAIGSALASIYGVYQQGEFNDDMLDMEKDRIAKANAKTDKQQENYDAVWA